MAWEIFSVKKRHTNGHVVSQWSSQKVLLLLIAISFNTMVLIQNKGCKGHKNYDNIVLILKDCFMNEKNN